MKRVIITGGSGMIGRALMQELANGDYEFIILSRNPARVNGLPAKARAVAWDGKSGQGWSEHINSETYIVNLAGDSIAPMPWYLPGRREAIRASRVNSGHAIADAVRAAKEKPRAVIQTSGVNFYGARGDEPATENTPAGNDFLAAVSVDWENATQDVEAAGVRRAIYRTGIVLSNKSGSILWYFALPFLFFIGGPMGNGKQWVPWIHITDEVRGIRFLIENENTRGVYNFVAPNPVSNGDMGRAIGRILHRPYWFPVPAFALKLVLGQMADELLLNGRRIKPERLQQAGFEFRYPEIESALRAVYQK